MSAVSIGVLALGACAALFVLGIVAGVLFLLWKVLRLVFRLLARVLGFLRRELVDGVHTLGALVTACATIPLAAVNLTILRLSSARHYGRAFVDELKGVGAGVWRVALGNPLRFLGLGALVEGVERRLPNAIAHAPRARRARRATFDGYDVIGTLPSGGSGAQLFVARPRQATLRRFQAAGRALPGEVVIKSFALESGSTLPQIVRESRALEAASRLGLVCEHQLSDDHFFYVMPYVKGEDLERVTRALHARASAEGLKDPELALVLGYGIDLLDALQRFHDGGLWHKDVKPSNVIIASGRAHLVDFGLVTPLASAMTLTTHGTEYYRDPEMVRLAMQGVKVHEVDGVRFDVYSAGAVLYALVENSFPAHGSLSRLSRRCPEALRWIVQRAMSDLGSRYPSAAEMRADLAALAAARDPFALRPADLPSFQPLAEPLQPVAIPAWVPPPALARVGARPASFTPPPAPTPAAPRRRGLGLVLAGASGLFALFVFATGALFLGGRARAHAREAPAFVPRPVASAPIPREWRSLSAREQALVDLAQGVADDLGADEAQAGEAQSGTEGGTAQRAASEPAPVALPEGAELASGGAPLPARGTVLVLDDLATQVDGRVLAHLRSGLLERGFLLADQPAEGEPDAAAVERIASARHAIGLGRADENQTRAGLQRFLDGQADLDALILVSRGEPEGVHLYHVFVRTDAAARTAGR